MQALGDGRWVDEIKSVTQEYYPLAAHPAALLLADEAKTNPSYSLPASNTIPALPSPRLLTLPDLLPGKRFEGAVVATEAGISYFPKTSESVTFQTKDIGTFPARSSKLFDKGRRFLTKRFWKRLQLPLRAFNNP